MSKSDYVGADPAKLDEIIRQAESRLASQLTIGIAADQRAMTFGGILTALASALVAVGATSKLSWAIGLMLACLLTATAAALFAALPTAWEVAGTSPADWIEDIAEGKDDLDSSKAAMADFYAEMIADNDARLAGNAGAIRLAFVATLMAPIVGVVGLILR